MSNHNRPLRDFAIEARWLIHSLRERRNEAAGSYIRAVKAGNEHNIGHYARTIVSLEQELEAIYADKMIATEGNHGCHSGTKRPLSS